MHWQKTKSDTARLHFDLWSGKCLERTDCLIWREHWNQIRHFFKCWFQCVCAAHFLVKQWPRFSFYLSTINSSLLTNSGVFVDNLFGDTLGVFYCDIASHIYSCKLCSVRHCEVTYSWLYIDFSQRLERTNWDFFIAGLLIDRINNRRKFLDFYVFP